MLTKTEIYRNNTEARRKVCVCVGQMAYLGKFPHNCEMAYIWSGKIPDCHFKRRAFVQFHGESILF